MVGRDYDLVLFNANVLSWELDAPGFSLRNKGLATIQSGC